MPFNFTKGLCRPFCIFSVHGMASQQCTVDLFYDIVSPFSYLAFEILCRCSRKWTRMNLRLEPVFLGGIMQATGNQPPAMLPARGRYMVKDLDRLSEYYGVDFKRPRANNVMNTGSLKAQRLLTAIKEECPEYLEEVSRQMYRRAWYKDEDVSEDESLFAACDAAGISKLVAENLLDQTKQDDVKATLRSSTTKAIGYGAFGAPTYVLHIDGKSEVFFGTDRLFLLAHYLGEPWPVSKL